MVSNNGNVDYSELDRIIKEQYPATELLSDLGITIASDEADSEGRLRVHAHGREDRDPSASFNTKTWWYKDFGSDQACSGYQLVADVLGLASWEAGREWCMKQRGIRLPSKARTPADKLRVDQLKLKPNGDQGYAEYAAMKIGKLCDSKSPAKREIASLYGARPGWWPSGSPSPQEVVVFPTRDPMGKDGQLRGALLYLANGEKFKAFGGLKERKSHLLKGSTDGWFLPCNSEGIAAAHTVTVCEGVFDAIALQAILPKGAIAVSNACGASSTKDLNFAFGAGKKIRVVGDADAAGVAGAKLKAAGFVKAGAAEVTIVSLPYPIEKKHGKDVRDYLGEGHSLDDFRDLCKAAKVVTESDIETFEPQPSRKKKHKRVQSSPDDHNRELPRIAADIDELRMTTETIAALSARDDLYQRGGVLVEVREAPDPPPCIVRPEGGVRAVQIPKPRLRELISDSAIFTTEISNGEATETVSVKVPAQTVDQVEARGQWHGIKPLEGVVATPQFLLDGSILSTPGYDGRSGLYMASECQFPEVPAKPTRDDAIRARNELLEVITDFPINEVGQAAWASVVLTGASRHAIDGPTPLFAFDANVRGSGKSLSADAVGIIHTGRQLPRTTAAGDDDEFRKRITAILLAGDPLVLIDNAAGVLGCASLDALLTSTTWTDRLLGKTEMTKVLPARSIWIATGNNLQFAADTARRTLRIRIESPLENPEERTGFKHPELLSWVRRERGRLAAAAVTILRAWHVAGRPTMNLSPWGSFDAWSRIIRSAVVWVDMDDPGETRQEVQRESDREAMVLSMILGAWSDADPSGEGMTVAQAVKLADQGNDALSSVLREVGERNGKINIRSVGMKLHHLRGRVCNGMYLDSRTTNAGKVWRICESDRSGTRGTSGTNPSPPRTHARAHAHAEESPAVLSSPTTTSSPTFESSGDWGTV